MEELQLTLTPSRVDQRNQGIMLSNWRVGQTINALVSDRMPNGGVLLSVGSHSFVTSRDIPVQPGARIKLEVQQMEPRLVLRVLQSSALNDTSPTPDVVRRASTTAGAGRANHLTSLLNFLGANSTSLAVSPHLNLSEISSLLANNYLTSRDLNAEAIRAAVMLSGVFTEALWASNRGGQGAKSTKTVLMILEERINAALKTANLSPAERSTLMRLSHNVEASLSSITHQQISSIPSDYEKPKWLLTMPLQLGDLLLEIDVEIERKASRRGDKIPDWKFNLSLTLETLGDVTVCIEMISGRLCIDLLVSELVAEPIRKALPVLRNQLLASGLELDKVSSTVLKVPPTDQHSHSQIKLDVTV